MLVGGVEVRVGLHEIPGRLVIDNCTDAAGFAGRLLRRALTFHPRVGGQVVRETCRVGVRLAGQRGLFRRHVVSGGRDHVVDSKRIALSPSGRKGASAAVADRSGHEVEEIAAVGGEQSRVGRELGLAAGIGCAAELGDDEDVFTHQQIQMCAQVGGGRGCPCRRGR